MNTTNTIERVCAAGHDEGLLKALVDGELSEVSRDELRAHVAGCRACSDRISQLRMDGALVTGRLRLLGEGQASARPPVALVLERARRPRPVEALSPGWWERVVGGARALPSWGPIRPLPFAGAALAATALLAVSFSQPAVQSFAQGVVQSLRVQRVEPIKIDPAVLRALPFGNPADLAKVGTYR